MSSSIDAADNGGKQPVDSKMTWLIKDGDGNLLGTVRLTANNAYQCVAPSSEVIETYKTLKFATEHLHRRGLAIPSEQHVARLKADVDQLSRSSPTERMFLTPDTAKVYGLDEAELQKMIEAEIAANEKQEQEKQRQDQEAQKRREAREEKQAKENKAKAKAERAEIDRADRIARRDRADQEREDRRARQLQRQVDQRLAIILAQPIAEHDVSLTEAAAQLGVDLDDLRMQFADLLDADRRRRGVGDIEPWPDPVNVNTLLNDIHKHRGRYAIIHDEHGGVAITLWTAHSWIHSVAVHSPPLLITSPDDEGNAAKTLLCSYLQWVTPRGRIVADPSGASFFHMIDHDHPTLILDNCENLFKRKKDLIDLLDASWTKGIPVTRQGNKRTVYYDVFCPKIIGAIAGSNFLPPNAMGRSIHFGMLPKLPHETVEAFAYADDEEFLTLRRKLARFALDNAEALKSADPTMPEGFDNRLRQNWRLLFAIADLAGGTWPKRARAAAVKLTKEYYEPSVGRQCLKMFVELFINSEYDDMVTSKWARQQFVVDPASIWTNYKGRGPITEWGIADILDRYHVRPDVIHPRGRPADRGYKLEWFETAFRHFLGVEIEEIRKRRRNRKK